MIVRRLVMALLAMTPAMAGCDATVPPAASSCGGSEVWPPAAVAELGLPAGVEIMPVDARTVRARNQTSMALRFDIAPWRLGPCVGWIEEETPVDRSLIDPGHEIIYQDDPPAGSVSKLGVRVYAAACDESCTDPPIGFGWIDLPMVRSPATP